MALGGVDKEGFTSYMGVSWKVWQGMGSFGNLIIRGVVGRRFYFLKLKIFAICSNLFGRKKLYFAAR